MAAVPVSVRAAALLAGLWAVRRGRAPLAAVLYFGGTLLPTLGFFNLYTFRYSLVANHYQYLACLGIIALASAAAATVLQRWRLWGHGRHALRRDRFVGRDAGGLARVQQPDFDFHFVFPGTESDRRNAVRARSVAGCGAVRADRAGAGPSGRGRAPADAAPGHALRLAFAVRALGHFGPHPRTSDSGGSLRAGW